ncbi:class I SAM-dependent methyltransferase [Demequina globuliformis]|uniref:class I SAM-dependent methyltransferase n=1 Tax=Demequina globuliformis TaxID=676202 RepID=UPI0007864866|nr:class I SAM-dependent methyltransferase [Demequina globuliformis]
MTVKRKDWSAYNAGQVQRETPRPLWSVASRLAGPGLGRVALDLGAGAGVESAAFVEAGWRVHAYDSDGTGLAALRERLPPEARDCVVTHEVDLASAPALPLADLIYAGYTLPWLPAHSQSAVWARVRAALTPGALLAVDLFGDRDGWSANPLVTCLSEREANARFDGLEILHWEEEDQEGESFSGPKRWHVFHVVARQPR